MILIMNRDHRIKKSLWNKFLINLILKDKIKKLIINFKMVNYYEHPMIKFFFYFAIKFLNITFCNLGQRKSWKTIKKQ